MIQVAAWQPHFVDCKISCIAHCYEQHSGIKIYVGFIETGMPVEESARAVPGMQLYGRHITGILDGAIHSD